MEHLLARTPWGRVLLVAVHIGPDGQGVGYGKMLGRLDRALRVARGMNVPVLLMNPRASMNRAIPFLCSDDVRILPPYGWRARALTLLWHLCAPWRIDNVSLALQRAMAQVLLGPVYARIERASWLPRRLRKRLMTRGRMYQYLKRVSYAYGRRANALWEARYKVVVVARDRELRQAGHPQPPIRLRLPAGRDAAVAAEAATLGIDPRKPIVTVHVRESGFRASAGLRQRDWDQLRNADIATYHAAFKELVKRGYTVVRIGDRSMTPISCPGVIDLVQALGPTDWIEVWSTLHSTFFIGSDSGPSWLVYLADVPLLTVNAVHFRDMLRPMDRIICKRARDTADGNTERREGVPVGRVLSVSEMLTEAFLREGFKSGRYAYIDNSRDDIKQAVIDMIEVVEGRERRSSWQDRFNRRLRELEHESSLEWSALGGVSIVRDPLGTLSRSFAKRYFLSAGRELAMPVGGSGGPAAPTRE